MAQKQGVLTAKPLILLEIFDKIGSQNGQTKPRHGGRGPETINIITMNLVSLNLHENSTDNHQPINLLKLLDPDFLDHVARKMNLCLRQRKISYGKLFLCFVAQVSGNNKNSTVTIESLRKKIEETLGISIQAKPLHNAIRKAEMTGYSLAILRGVYDCLGQVVGKRCDKTVARLAKDLGGKDIIAIDGVEVPAYPGCEANFGPYCKSKQEGKCAFKLHIAYSLLKRTVLYIDITSAVESERSHVHPDLLKDCLVIMDRGYCSLAMEEEPDRMGVKYLVRAKEKANGRVVKSYHPETGLELKRNPYQGCSLRGLCSSKSVADKDTDYLFETSNAPHTTQRVVCIKKPGHVKRGKGAYGVYRTNLSRDVCSAKTIYSLYRLRWQVELLAKSMKSGNSLAGINSGLLSINALYISACLVSAAVKLYYAVKTFSCDLAQMSMLKVNMTFDAFKSFLIDLAKGLQKSAIYVRICELKDNLQKNCKRSKPSQRDADLLKDQRLLVMEIIKEIRHTKSVHRRCGFMA